MPPQIAASTSLFQEFDAQWQPIPCGSCRQGLSGEGLSWKSSPEGWVSPEPCRGNHCLRLVFWFPSGHRAFQRHPVARGGGQSGRKRQNLPQSCKVGLLHYDTPGQRHSTVCRSWVPWLLLAVTIQEVLNTHQKPFLSAVQIHFLARKQRESILHSWACTSMHFLNKFSGCYQVS